MKLFDLLAEMPIETFNTIGDFNRSSAFRKEPDRKLLTNPKTVEKVRSMWANTYYDFRFWFVNNAEANAHANAGVVTLEWMQKTMPKTLAEIMQQGGFGDEAINMIYAGNKGGNWRPMTGWIMAHRMAHMVLAGARGGNYLGQRPMDRIERELILNLQPILNAYQIEMPRGDRWSLIRDNPMILNLFKQMGSMRSARSNNVDNGAEFVFEMFAQWLLTGSIKFNPLPDNLIVGYSYGRPQYRRVYGPVDKEQADEYAGYLADILGQEFEYAMSTVHGRIVIM